MIDSNSFCKIGEPKRSKLRGRSGGMLILVLIIMAVGVILITSAMSITIASRNRYYQDSITGQARLTATAAVKSIVAAVGTQEIRDAEIEALAANNATLTMTSASSTAKNAGAGTGNSIAPGIATAANSYTHVSFSYYPNATAKTYIAVDVETGLTASGAATSDTEHVRAFLKYNPPTAGDVDAFGAMVTAGGDGASNVFRNFRVGQGATAAASSNYVILHGNFNVGDGTIVSYGDVIYTGRVSASAGTTYNGDIVFYGDTAGITSLAGNGFIAQGSLMFIGVDPSLASVFRNTDGSKRNNTEGFSGGVKGYDGIYFYNTSFVSSQAEGLYPGNKDLWNIFVDGTSTFKETLGYVHTGTYGGEDPNVSTNDKMIKLSSSSTVTYNSTKTINVDATQSAKFTGDIQAAAAKYMSADWTAASERKIPTTAQAIAMTGYSASNLTTAVALDAKLSINGIYTAPAYKINASGAPVITGELEFDLTYNDITIYVYGTGTLTIGSSGNPGLIKFTNGGAHWGKIILVQGVNLKLVEDYTSGVDNGILSTPHTAPDQIATAASGKPYLYIMGLGGNKVDTYQFSRIEAYIGMYGNPAVTATDSPGSILFHNGPYAYGRFEAVNLGNPADTGGSFIDLYYCPSPTDPDGGTGKVAIKSNYTLEGYEYYS